MINIFLPPSLFARPPFCSPNLGSRHLHRRVTMGPTSALGHDGSVPTALPILYTAEPPLIYWADGGYGGHMIGPRNTLGGLFWGV